MAVTLDLVSKNSLPALGGTLTFKSPSTSAIVDQRIFILNVGMLVNAGIYSLTFTNGAPTNVKYLNLLDGDNAVIDKSFVDPVFSTTFNFDPSKPFAKIVFVSESDYVHWPANSNAVVSSGLISSTSATPTPTIPSVAATHLTNALTCRSIGGVDYVWSYPTYDVSTGTYYAGKIVKTSDMSITNLDSNNRVGASQAFDYTNNKMYLLGGGVYNSAVGVQSHSQLMYANFDQKDMAAQTFTVTPKASYPNTLNTMNTLMCAPGDGNVYTFGQSYIETSNVPTSYYYGESAHKWTAATNTWSEIAKMPGTPSVSAVSTFVFSYEGIIYISGVRNTAVDKGSKSIFDYWFGKYTPATNAYTTIKTYKSATKSFDLLGIMNGRTYIEDATHLYDVFGNTYSKATIISTGFIPAATVKPQSWAPTATLSVAYTPGSATQYAQYLSSSNYYLIAETQAQISVPTYAIRT